jgi:cold shock protein
MTAGTIVWFNPGKSYGFIRPDDGGADVFLPFHVAQHARMMSVEAGARVRFECEPPPNGKRAPVVTRLEPAD